MCPLVFSSSFAGLSLFRVIPDSRTCDDAGISALFCVCRNLVDVPVDSLLVTDSVNVAVQAINDQLDNVTQLCHHLKLEAITGAQIANSSKSIGSIKNSYIDIIVTFQITPGGGLFQANIRQYKLVGGLKLQGEIIRLNRYERTADCIVENADLRNFCYCYSNDKS